MNDLMLKTTVRVNRWTDTAVTRLRRRYAAGDRGQSALEYLGICLVVVAIIGAILATGIGGAISERIRSLVGSIASG
ncbi:hypothetical protein [Streptomyces sp. NPDC006879]|uniref:hypothetical protein n=1 Tax=Streptomyces sp. NPDC006879 TaxID=3364767 RepID=UPI0036B8A6CE